MSKTLRILSCQYSTRIVVNSTMFKVLKSPVERSAYSPRFIMNMGSNLIQFCTAAVKCYSPQKEIILNDFT